VLVFVIGAYAVALGILFVGASFELPLDGADRAATVLAGLVAITFGIVISPSRAQVRSPCSH